MVRDRLDLWQVEGRQPHSGADQDAFCRLAGGLLEYLILPQGHTFRMLMFHRLKQQVQRRDVFVIILPDFSVFQHAHDHGKVLFILRRFLVQHEDDGLEQSCFGLRPEWVGLMTALGRGCLDQRIHQLQCVFFIPQVAKGVITVRLFQIHKIQHPDVIAPFFQVSARVGQDFHFRVRDHIIGIGLQDVGLHITASLGRAAAADDQHIQGAPVFVGIQPQPHMAGQDLILFLTELRIDLPGRAPHGRAMFLAIPRPAAFRVIDAQAHNVNAGTNQDGQQALVRPLNLERVLQRGGQVGEQIRQTAAKGLCNEQRRPDDRDIEEKAQN